MAVTTALRPRIFAQFAKALRPAYAAIRMVGRDLTPEAGYHGQTITIPIQRGPDKSRVRDFVEGLTPTAAPSANNPQPSTAQCTLTEYKDRPLEMGAKEYGEVIRGVVSNEIGTAALDMAAFLNAAVFDQYKQIPHVVFARNPFRNPTTANADELEDMRKIDKKAADNDMPSEGRVLLLGSGAYSNARTNRRLSDADKTGAPPGMNTLNMFADRGYTFVQDREAPLSEGVVGTAVANGGVAIGDKTVTFDGGSSNFAPKDGDVLFAPSSGTTAADTSDDAEYVGVVASATATVITLHDPVTRALADNVKLATVKGRQNLLVSPGAIQFAQRIPKNPAEEVDPELAAKSNMMVDVDPITGHPICMLYWQGMNKIHWTFLALYGLVVPQPARALRIVSID